MTKIWVDGLRRRSGQHWAVSSMTSRGVQIFADISVGVLWSCNIHPKEWILLKWHLVVKYIGNYLRKVLLLIVIFILGTFLLDLLGDSRSPPIAIIVSYGMMENISTPTMPIRESGAPGTRELPYTPLRSVSSNSNWSFQSIASNSTDSTTFWRTPPKRRKASAEPKFSGLAVLRQ